jgi:hypothetical protein
MRGYTKVDERLQAAVPGSVGHPYCLFTRPQSPGSYAACICRVHKISLEVTR